MITVTPIIDLTQKTNYVFRHGATGSMAANNFNDVWGGATRLKDYVPYVNGDQPQGVDMFLSCERAGATNRMYICGLDGEGLFIDEEKNLDGQNKVQLSNQYFRIFNLINMENPIIPVSPGDPNRVFVFRNTTVTTGTPDDLTKVEMIIGSFSTYGFPDSLATHFTIPFNMKGYVESYEASLNYETADSRSIFYLMANYPGHPISSTYPLFWSQLQSFSLNTSGTNSVDILKASKNNKGIPLPPGTDIVMVAYVGAAINIVSASIDIRLEQLR